MLIELAKEWHFYRLIDGAQGRGYKNSRLNFAAWRTTAHVSGHLYGLRPSTTHVRRSNHFAVAGGSTKR
jgi:hypothetical protein